MRKEAIMKTCVITGSNRGIGLELVRSYLHREDWHVHACCREPERADALREAVTSHLGRITLHKLDVADPQSVAALAKDLGGAPVDLLINNAGVKGGAHQTLEDMDFEDFTETLAVNTVAPLRVTQALLPSLRAAKSAQVVTISSQMGALSRPSAGVFAYRTSKAAVNKLMQGVAEELRADGIACILFHPGWVKTDMGGAHADITPKESAEGIAATIGKLTLKDTGGFFKWNGERHDW